MRALALRLGLATLALLIPAAAAAQARSTVTVTLQDGLSMRGFRAPTGRSSAPGASDTASLRATSAAAADCAGSSAFEVVGAGSSPVVGTPGVTVTPTSSGSSTAGQTYCLSAPSANGASGPVAVPVVVQQQ